MNNLRKFQTIADYQAAELVKPAVSLIVETDGVYFDPKEEPIFSGLTVYYNITDISSPTTLFKGGGGSGSGSGSGSGGVLPSAMIIDGTDVEVTNTYQFSTIGEHIINYSFADNQIPQMFLYDENHIFNNVVKVLIGDAVTSISDYAFVFCSSLTSVTIPDSVTRIGGNAFNSCSSLTSVNIPSGVTSIGDSTFDGCSSLTSIVCNATTAPTIANTTFIDIKTNGTLTVPSGSSGYDVWMQNVDYYLGLYNWTKVEQ